MSDRLCYLNGAFMPLAAARIPVLDRGFIFGDGVYDVVPAYGRRLFCFDEHIARLKRSLAQIRLPELATPAQWLALCRHLVAAEPADDQVVYIQVTRGVAPRDHVMLANPTPTVFIMSNPMVPPTAVQRRDGVACVTAEDFRWARGDIKSTSLLGNVMARQLSADEGAAETILFRDGYLTEAAASNVWVVCDGVLAGPPKSDHVLEGIRCGLLQALCQDVGIPYMRRPIARAEVRGSDELLLSSATKEVLPVTRLDGAWLGRGNTRGKPGPVHALLHQAYQRAKRTMSV